MSSRKNPRYIYNKETSAEAKRRYYKKIVMIRKLFAQKRKINAGIARLQKEINFLSRNSKTMET